MKVAGIQRQDCKIRAGSCVSRMWHACTGGVLQITDRVEQDAPAMAAHGQQEGDLLPAAGPPQTPLCLPPQAPQEVRPPFHHHQTSLLPYGTSSSAVSSACPKHVSLRPRSNALRTFAFQPNMEGLLHPATAICRMPQNASLLERWACKGQLTITDAPCLSSGILLDFSAVLQRRHV